MGRTDEWRRGRAARQAVRGGGRWLGAAGFVAVLAACTGGGGIAGGTSTTVVGGTTTSTAPIPRKVGPLRIGVLLPSSATNASFGAPLLNAVRVAVADVNAAGGVNGVPVQLFEEDEGADLAATLARLNKLITDDGVDAVIGPASSRSALAAIDVANREHVAVCSPTARTLSLASYPDNRFFVRTMPSDELEARAIARTMLNSGRQSAAVLYSDDEYGLAMAGMIRTTVASGLAVTPVAYAAGSPDVSDAVRKAMAAAPESLVVIGGADDGARVLAELYRAGAPAAKIPTFVSDAMLRPNLIDEVAPGRADGLTNVAGITPAAAPIDPEFAAHLGASGTTGTNFAAYAYDCVTLVALAAQSDRTNDPRVFTPMIADVSQVGSVCHDYGECAALLASGRNIDLQGESGSLDVRPNGDVGSGRFEVFTFDATGRDLVDATITVGPDGR